MTEGHYLFLDRPHEDQMLRNWRDIETPFLTNTPDEKLLQMAETVSITSGYGVIAEILKRYEKLIGK